MKKKKWERKRKILKKCISDDRRDWKEQKETNCQEALEKLKGQFEAQKKKTDELRKQSTEQELVLNKVIGQVDDMFKYVLYSLKKVGSQIDSNYFF